MSRTASMTTAKRWIAVVATVSLVALGASTLGLLSLAVTETGNGADPAGAFQGDDLRLGDVAWSIDAPDLVRPIDQASRDALGSSWIRSQNALRRAAGGDLSGIGTWFVDGARRRALDRYEGVSAGSVRAPAAATYELTVEFVSLDGQIVVLEVRASRSDGRVDRSRAVMVTDAGAWRVRAITATGDV
ncbi:MAG: hypothetical protein AAGD33_09825 [Actinomycetota bacterium]